MTDDERRRVVAELREMSDWDDEVDCTDFGKRVSNLLYRALGCDGTEGDFYAALADLIEPTDGFDLDTVQRACFECMEGCDEPEWTLYTTIYSAIARYKRGESGPTYGRDALLALADEMDHTDSEVGWTDDAMPHFARRIREALGVSDDA